LEKTVLQRLKSTIYKAFIPSKEFARRERLFWKNRQSEEDGTLDMYWEQRFDSPNRDALVNIINALQPKSILEFGSYCGPNLELLQRSNSNQQLSLYAVEPNLPACKFLSEKLPDVKVYNFGDLEFVESNDLPRHVDIAFANGVFYLMEPQNTKQVLARMASISPVIIIGDELDNRDGKKSIFSRKFLSFHHPYQTWLEELGFKSFNYQVAPKQGRATNGFLVASNRLGYK
jgi:hypothetical protein